MFLTWNTDMNHRKRLIIMLLLLSLAVIAAVYISGIFPTIGENLQLNGVRSGKKSGDLPSENKADLSPSPILSEDLDKSDENFAETPSQSATTIQRSVETSVKVPTTAATSVPESTKAETQNQSTEAIPSGNTQLITSTIVHNTTADTAVPEDTKLETTSQSTEVIPTGDAELKTSKLAPISTVASSINEDEKSASAEISSDLPVATTVDPVKLVESITAISGATGQLFKGEVIREFPGSDRKFVSWKPQKPSTKSGNQTCEKTGVVTTIFKMSVAVKRFLYMKEWCLVVVGDKKQAKNYFGEIQHFSNKVYHLTAKLQLKMGWDLVKLLPWNDVARKNIGYAYAISLGAKYIWDFDDDNQLNFFIPNLERFGAPSLDNFVNEVRLNSSLTAVDLTEVKCLAFNIFGHMLNKTYKSTIWPRGYPLESINDKRCSEATREPIKLEPTQLAAVQSLADKELDYDAIFRLTKKVFKFWLHLPGYNELLLLPKNTFTPYNGQSILQLYPGFWSLYLPFTVNGRVSDIWRSYAAERLFREANLRWGFFSRPIVVQDRNSHKYLADFLAESDLYKKSEKLLQFLDNWNTTANSLPAMIEDLWIGLYERDYVGLKDVYAIQEWIKLLTNIGYQFPKVKENSKTEYTEDTSTYKRLPDNYGLVTLQIEPELNDVEKKCQNLPRRTFWTSDIHDGTRVAIPSVLTHFGQNVTLAGHMGSDGFYPDVWQQPGVKIHKNTSKIIDNLKTVGKDISESDIQANFEFFKLQPEIAETDAFVCSFPASMCELWLPFNKSIIFQTSHRYNLGRCSLPEWNNLDHLLKVMSTSVHPKHIVAAASQYDMEYLEHYTGLNPVFLEAYSGYYTNTFKYNPTNNVFLILGALHKVETIKSQNISDLEEVYPKYKLEQLVSHPGIIYMPYSVMSFKLTEFYAMGIPLFMPSLKYYYDHEFGIDRTSVSKMYCRDGSNQFKNPNEHLKKSHPNSAHPYSPNSEAKEAQLYWLQFSDFYLLPHITYFENSTDLEAKLASTNLTDIHDKMMAVNRGKLKRVEKNWCRVIKQIDAGRPVPESYAEAIQQLYGLKRISVL